MFCKTWSSLLVDLHTFRFFHLLQKTWHLGFIMQLPKVIEIKGTPSLFYLYVDNWLNNVIEVWTKKFNAVFKDDWWNEPNICWVLYLQSLVPLGSVEELLAAYDSQRRELPPPVTVWEWGWTRSAETWNGRAAMLAVLVLLVLEVTTGEGFLHQWGILPLFR